MRNREAIEGARETLELTDGLGAAIGSGGRAMTTPWTVFQGEPGLLPTAVQDRAETLRKQTGRLPASVKADDVARACEEARVMHDAFNEANRPRS